MKSKPKKTVLYPLMNNNNLIIRPTGSRLWASYFYNLLIGKPIFITVSFIALIYSLESPL